MSLFSKQQIFCNACGKEQHRELPGIGKDYKTCSVRCLWEMQWRAVLSLMNKEYRPDPRKYDDAGYEIKSKDST